MTPAALKLAREAAGLNQRNFARLIGVTPGAVSLWESGQRKIPRWLGVMVGLLKTKEDK